jgi:glycopeptide antibiotics resistance protein
MWQACDMIRGPLFLFAAVVAGVVWFAAAWNRRPDRRGESVAKLLFGLYLAAVVVATMFPIPLSGDGPSAIGRINLIPFRGLFDSANISSEQAVPNILLGVPFGFLLFFVVQRLSPRNVLLAGFAFFASIEALQVVLGVLVPAAPRTGDINDLMLNTFGVWLGIVGFRTFTRSVRRRGAEEVLGTGDVGRYIADTVTESNV